MSVLGTIGAIGAIGGAAIGAGGSIAAANTQAGAAHSAARLQYQEAEDALKFQEQQYQENVARSQPWITAGTGAINELSRLTSTPGEGLLTPWTDTFQAPQLNNTTDPGYLARLSLGQQTLENSAAARGGVLTGGTAKDLTQFAQDYASNEYSNVFNRALTQYQQAYNIFQNNQANTYNRLAGVAGAGQTSVTTLGNQGQAAAGNVANINLTAGGQIGNSLLNAGAATASGYVGAANALSGGLGSLTTLAALQNLLNPSSTNPGNVPISGGFVG